EHEGVQRTQRKRAPYVSFVNLCVLVVMNLYEQQAANRRKTWLIMLAFIGFLFFLGAGFDALYIGEGGGFVPVGSLLALTVGSVSSAISYFAGDRAVLLATAAKPVDELAATASDEEKLKLQRLSNVVD